MGATYDANEAEQIYAAFSTCDVWSIGVVRVYKAVGGSWNFTGITGAAVMASEKGPNEEDLCYVRVFDLKTNTTVFEQELWYFFNYEQATSWFHTFESNEHVYGLSFADEGEAADFYAKVLESVEIQKGQAPPEADPANQEYQEEPAPVQSYSAPPPAAARPPAPAGPPPPGPSGPPPAAPTHQMTNSGSSGNLGQAQVIEGLPMKAIPIRNALIGKDSPSQPKQPPKKGGGGLLGKMFGGKKKDEPHVPVVGAPTDFKHESHIGWDPERGFEIRNIPPEWKALFQAAGVKKSELTNATTAKMIMETVVEVVSGVAPPPPPPPPGPPPPPVPGAPRPPPAPAPGGAPAGGGGGGGGGGRGDLLSQIQAGKKLNKVDESAPLSGGVPDLKNLDAQQGANLAQILSDRLQAMRPALEDVDSDEEQADRKSVV